MLINSTLAINNSGDVISFAIESQMRCSHSIEIERQRKNSLTKNPVCTFLQSEQAITLLEFSPTGWAELEWHTNVQVYGQ